MTHQDAACLIAEFAQERRFPVVLIARWKRPVEQRLHLREGHGLDGIEQRRAERSERLQRMLTRNEVAAIAGDDSDSWLAVGRVQKSRVGGQLLRRGLRE